MINKNKILFDLIKYDDCVFLGNHLLLRQSIYLSIYLSIIIIIIIIII